MSKLSQTYGVTYQNLGEKGTKSIEKELSQSGLPVLRKIQKNARNYPKRAKVDFRVISGIFWGFSQNW